MLPKHDSKRLRDPSDVRQKLEQVSYRLVYHMIMISPDAEFVASKFRLIAVLGLEPIQNGSWMNFETHESGAI